MEELKVLKFSKYHGCGNNFLLVSNLSGEYDNIKNKSELIKRICDPDFGLGSDGILFLGAHEKYAFTMEYYNARYGKLSGFCGNGSRCSIKFAEDNGIIKTKTGKYAVAGKPYDFSIEDNNLITVSIGEFDTKNIERLNDSEYDVNLASRHHVKFIENVEAYDVHTEGKAIRYSDRYKEPDSRGITGTNASFVEDLLDSKYRVRTYERSVERETKACCSGCVSSALVAAVKSRIGLDGTMKHHKNTMVTNGGDLVVEFEYDGGPRVRNLRFTGPAVRICTGVYYL